MTACTTTVLWCQTMQRILQIGLRLLLMRVLALKCTLDIAYGDGPNETLDIFPASKPNAPVVFFIHGGYLAQS